MRNKFDRDGAALASGMAAESSFELAALANQMSVRKATRQENFTHIDYFIQLNGAKENSVDVKARKKIKRSDDDVNNDHVWIEFKNVQGKRGWIYGKADLIAFEREDSFLLVDRKLLARLCEKLVDLSQVNTNLAFPLYVGYQRRNRKDMLSLIKISDITSNIKHSFIKKPCKE